VRCHSGGKEGIKDWMISEADCMFLIEEGTGVILEDVKLYFERDMRHGPEGIANAIAHIRELCLVVGLLLGEVACFGVGISQFVFSMHA